jgi:peroxiredoxin
MPRIKVGASAPEFGLGDHQGQTVQLSSYRGAKHVLLVFNRGFV